MNLSLDVRNFAEVQAELKALGENAVHAQRIWVNSLGEHMQTAMQTQIGKNFTFRGTRDRFEKAVVWRGVTNRVSGRNRVSGELTVGTTQNSKSATSKLGQLLARHENAEARTSNNVFKTSSGMIPGGFYLPAKGMRTSTSNPARALYPTSIGALIRFDGKMNGEAYYANNMKSKGKGKNKVTTSYFATKLGIFERVLKGKERALWWFSKGVRTPARLGMWAKADEVMERFAVGYGWEAVQIVIDRSS